MWEGPGSQCGRGTVACTFCWRQHHPPGTSEVFALQEVGPLQDLDVALVDLEGGAEADGQTGQHVAALHQEEGLPVDLLVGRKETHQLEEEFLKIANI